MRMPFKNLAVSSSKFCLAVPARNWLKSCLDPPPMSFPISSNRASLKFESKIFSSELIDVGMNRPIVDDRHTNIAAGTKIFEFLVDDFHV
ncbi:hypothetical protein AYI70_g3686 [Smittium culicis]|uniref:Uncharacterized protein n=1 Tax=Smittium culicis TaxID=133412 RepID=A0A1R1Y2S3_9FUNG|nr:hypothetical protein AYI70_g3686 [Smittium culicis]